MDSGRDQFKPGPRRGAAGGLGGFEVLGAIVFLAGCLPAVGHRPSIIQNAAL